MNSKIFTPSELNNDLLAQDLSKAKRKLKNQLAYLDDCFTEYNKAKELLNKSISNKETSIKYEVNRLNFYTDKIADINIRIKDLKEKITTLEQKIGQEQNSSPEQI